MVVSPDTGFGARGRFAYPWYGWGWGAGYGRNPGSSYYDLPYEENEIGEMEPFDHERMGAD